MNTIYQKNTNNIDIGTIIIYIMNFYEVSPSCCGCFFLSLCRQNVFTYLRIIQADNIICQSAVLKWFFNFKWISITSQNSFNPINVIIHIMYNLMHTALGVYLPICDKLVQYYKHQSQRYYRSCWNYQYSSNIHSWCLYLSWIVIFCVIFIGLCFWLKGKQIRLATKADIHRKRSYFMIQLIN